MVRLSSAYLP
ncbi:hypothetical protein LINPERPRIM_LOCUS10051 [Linum perenne]